MNFQQYQADAFRTAKVFNNLPMDLAHVSLGLATETGEFTTEVKRALIYSKPITPEMTAHMAEELGDVLWYLAMAAEHLGVSLDDIASQNIAKLQARFPEKYSDAAAEARADKNGLTARES